MLTLGMDTSNKYLNLALIKDDQLIASLHQECFKHQSEEILPQLDLLFKNNGIKTSDIDSIVITQGPGSYTGIRIAMTLAKVWAKTKNLKLYTLDSLQLIAGKVPTTAVYIDARGHRGYVGIFEEGKAIMADTVFTESEFKEYHDQHPDDEVRGDLDFIGYHDEMDDINQHFLDLKEDWVLVDPIDPLKAKYLKEATEYLTK